MAKASNTVVLAAITGLLGGLGGAWAFQQFAGKKEIYSSVHPPIAIIDYAQAARASNASVDDVMDDLDRDAARLKAAGFLVLNRSAVIAYPDSLQVEWTPPGSKAGDEH